MQIEQSSEVSGKEMETECSSASCCCMSFFIPLLFLIFNEFAKWLRCFWISLLFLGCFFALKGQEFISGRHKSYYYKTFKIVMVKCERAIAMSYEYVFMAKNY